MQSVDIAKYLAQYAATYAPNSGLNGSQTAGITAILGFLMADDKIQDIRWAAYMLATVKHECAGTWQPIEEYGKGQGRPYGVPDKVTGKVYFGRGYTQNTWKANYQMLTDAWKRANPDSDINFVNSPDLLLVPEYSYFAMSYAMRNGAYTGVGLNRYIHDDVCEYSNARKIINGTDQADKIAGYATTIEAILRSCPA